MTRREARIWIRQHFAGYVRMTDAVSGGENDVIEEVWKDEVARISKRILSGSPEGDPFNQ